MARQEFAFAQVRERAVRTAFGYLDTFSDEELKALFSLGKQNVAASGAKGAVILTFQRGPSVLEIAPDIRQIDGLRVRPDLHRIALNLERFGCYVPYISLLVVEPGAQVLPHRHWYDIATGATMPHLTFSWYRSPTLPKPSLNFWSWGNQTQQVTPKGEAFFINTCLKHSVEEHQDWAVYLVFPQMRYKEDVREKFFLFMEEKLQIQVNTQYPDLVYEAIEMIKEKQ